MSDVPFLQNHEVSVNRLGEAAICKFTPQIGLTKSQLRDDR